MTWLAQLRAAIRSRLSALAGRRALRSRVDEEMRFHLEMRAEHLTAFGLSPEQARREARRIFGNPSLHRETALDMGRYGTVERLLTSPEPPWVSPSPSA